MSTWALILAGGYAWPMEPIDHIAPRPLLPFGDGPLIGHALRWVSGSVNGATICANGHTRPLRDALGDGAAFEVPLYYYEDLAPRGPAGCLRDAGLPTGAATLIVIEGTVVPRFSLGSLLAAHRASQAAVTVVANRIRRPDASQELLPAGVYVISEPVLHEIQSEGYQDLKEIVVPQLHRRGQRVRVYEPERACPRVRGVSSYLALHGWLLNEMGQEAATWAEYARCRAGWAHPSARVAPDARLAGPALIGPNAVIEPGATIIGPAAIGAGSIIERDAILSRSVVWEGCRIEQAAHVDRSVLANDVLISAGTRVMAEVCTPRKPRGGFFDWLRGRAATPAPSSRRSPLRPEPASPRPQAPRYTPAARARKGYAS